MKALVLVFACVVAAVAAQGVGSLAGVVTDRSGAVLPGVTVSAIGSAPVENVRTVVTGARGPFEITGLLIGEYGVSFSRPGFMKPERDRVEAAGGTAAKVDAVMRVAGINDTISSIPLAPRVLCGLTILPVDPRLDAKIRKPIPNNDTRSVIQTIPPSICGNR